MSNKEEKKPLYPRNFISRARENARRVFTKGHFDFDTSSHTVAHVKARGEAGAHAHTHTKAHEDTFMALVGVKRRERWTS